jgi:hypothetical protein
MLTSFASKMPRGKPRRKEDKDLEKAIRASKATEKKRKADSFKANPVVKQLLYPVSDDWGEELPAAKTFKRGQKRQLTSEDERKIQMNLLKNAGNTYERKNNQRWLPSPITFSSSIGDSPPSVFIPAGPVPARFNGLPPSAGPPPVVVPPANPESVNLPSPSYAPSWNPADLDVSDRLQAQKEAKEMAALALLDLGANPVKKGKKRKARVKSIVGGRPVIPQSAVDALDHLIPEEDDLPLSFRRKKPKGYKRPKAPSKAKHPCVDGKRKITYKRKC